MKGQKTGGRQKGTPNKMTAEKREFLGNLLSDNFELIQQDFLNLDSYQRCNILVKILPYIMPKMQPVSETEEQKRAAEQLRLYSNLADKVFFWEQQKQKQQEEQEEQQRQQQMQQQMQMQQEEAKHPPRLNSSTLDNTVPSFSVGGDSVAAQSDSDSIRLNSSILDYLTLISEVVGPSILAESSSEPSQNSSTLDNPAPVSEGKGSSSPAESSTPQPSPEEIPVSCKPKLSATQSSSESPSLKTSILDTAKNESHVAGAPYPAQSEKQKPSPQKSKLRFLKQQQHRPFYTAIANKRHR